MITNRDARAELSSRERPIYLGSIFLEPPADGIAAGEGRIVYQGRDVGLTKAETRVAFRLPSPTYANEWELVSGVLHELDETSRREPSRRAAAGRVRARGGGRVRESAARGLGVAGSRRPREALGDAAGAGARGPALRAVRPALLEGAALGRRGGGGGAREAQVAAGDGGGRGRSMRRCVQSCVLGLGLVVVGAVGLDGQGVVRLAADSPLVAQGAALFAVAEDGRTLVTPAPGGIRALGPRGADAGAPVHRGAGGGRRGALSRRHGGRIRGPCRPRARGSLRGPHGAAPGGAAAASPRARARAAPPRGRRRDARRLRPSAWRRNPHADPASLPALSRARPPVGERVPVRGPRPRFDARADTGGARGPARRHGGHHPEAPRGRGRSRGPRSHAAEDPWPFAPGSST